MSNPDATRGHDNVSIVLGALQALSRPDGESSVRCAITMVEAQACKIASATASLGDDLWRRGDCIALSFVCMKRYGISI